MTIEFTNPAINYYVDDVEVAARFYKEDFGFVEIVSRRSVQPEPDADE